MAGPGAALEKAEDRNVAKIGRAGHEIATPGQATRGIAKVTEDRRIDAAGKAARNWTIRTMAGRWRSLPENWE